MRDEILENIIIENLKLRMVIDKMMNNHEEERLKRIEKRNGKEQLEIFKQKWIPLEERYFTEQNIRERVDEYIRFAKEVS